MARVSKKPPDLPSSNDLDKFPAPEPAEIRLGNKVICVLANPPELGQNVDLMIRIHVKEQCTAIHDDGETVNYLRAKLLGSAWRPGERPPADVDQLVLGEDDDEDEDGESE